MNFIFFKRELIIVCCIFFVLNSNAAANVQLPEDLAKHARKLGCSDVPDYYNRPGMVEPPYIYGVLSAPKHLSAAFWCYKEDAEVPYTLVIVFGDKIESKLHWKNYPGGLSVLTDKKYKLSKFRYIENPEKFGPLNIYTSTPIINSEYDGVVTLFYYFEGKWMFFMID